MGQESHTVQGKEQSEESEVLLHLRNITEQLSHVLLEVDILGSRIGQLQERILKVEDTVFQFAKGSQTAFQQVVQACTCLREELSESAGTIIDSTYLD